MIHCLYRYESDETPMTEYLNIHHTLNNCRTAARNGDSSSGPRTLVSCKYAHSLKAVANIDVLVHIYVHDAQVVGPTDVGKSTLCRLLLNYAVRSNWTPTMIDLDIGEPVTFFYTILLQRRVIVHRAVLFLRLYVYVDEYMSFATVAAIEA